MPAKSFQMSLFKYSREDPPREYLVIDKIIIYRLLLLNLQEIHASDLSYKSSALGTTSYLNNQLYSVITLQDLSPRRWNSE